jgi:DNA-binding response OmpR family regulator
MVAAALVVEDDPVLVSSLRAALTAHPVQLECVTTAASAISLLDAQPFCGLVLDLVLEEGSGFDVLRHLRTRGLSLPTLVITARLPSYVREMLDEEQIKLVLPKPVDAKLLAALVLGLCGIPS